MQCSCYTDHFELARVRLLYAISAGSIIANALTKYASPRKMAYCHTELAVSSLVLNVPTHGGMAKLRWIGCAWLNTKTLYVQLVTHLSTNPARRALTFSCEHNVINELNCHLLSQQIRSDISMSPFCFYLTHTYSTIKQCIGFKAIKNPSTFGRRPLQKILCRRDRLISLHNKTQHKSYHAKHAATQHSHDHKNNFKVCLCNTAF